MQQREWSLLVYLVVGIAVHHHRSECKFCPSLDIRNNASNLTFLRGCKAINGSLKILLMERVMSENAFASHSYPDLVEISEFLLVYRVQHLTNLGQLFPNLKIIRGKKLHFNRYAIVVFRMPHLTQIGLTNLTHIERGGVKVDYCPELCYVNRINWTHIGASFLDYHSSPEFCMTREVCPTDCNFCWNRNVCQKINQTDNCHNECFGCKKDDSPSHCHACKNYKIISENSPHYECVRTCPSYLLRHNYTMSCVTEQQCRSLFNNSWVFGRDCLDTCPERYQPSRNRDTCVFCGDGCVFHCPGTVISSKAMLEEMSRCTHIDGSLEIRISEVNLEWELRRLRYIREINGSLLVSRSVIRSLDFLSNLRVITGEPLQKGVSAFALFIYKNENLQSLFNLTGDAKLDIQGEVAIHDNPQLCYTVIEQFSQRVLNKLDEKDLELFKRSNGDKASCNIIQMETKFTEQNPTNVTITWRPSGYNKNPIAYTLYYRETEGDVTSADSKDVCDDHGWVSLFVAQNSLQVTNLAAFTRYAYYIKALFDSTTNGSYYAETDIQYFRTPSDEPTEPKEFMATPESEDAIVLTWGRPQRENGNLSHYILTYFLEPDYLPARNYCRHKYINDDKAFYKPQNLPMERPPQSCACKRQVEYRIFQKDVMQLCHDKYDESCKHYMYAMSHGLDDVDTVLRKMRRRSVPQLGDTFTTEYSGRSENATYGVFNISENRSNNTFTVRNLRHFTLYLFFLRACNSNGTHEQCGPIEMTSKRTMKSHSADYVLSHDVSVRGNHAEVVFTPANATNSYVVAYQVARQKVDDSTSIPHIRCIAIQEYHKDLKVHYDNLFPGNYSVQVQVISLAGPGLPSPAKYFLIEKEEKSIAVPVSLTLLFVALTAAVLAVSYYYWRRKHLVDNIHLIPSINPDYAGPTYVPDEWELEREDIHQGEAVGKGSFGLVYSGRIKSRNCDCAIKTVAETASMATRLEFLNEGARMKNLSECHHVVKLLGIVSAGQPPLVIMEFMEFGDLKTFLRRCRGSSQSLTSIEMYKMAAEIADGMAYLSAKKFVHRDLAARNCMVAADKTVKIGDFGMARDVYETDYYRKETVGLLPVRWMAPESLADGVFTSDSDCWSYGVVLYEMATLGEQPYQGMSNEQVLNFVKRGGKLNRPQECSDLFFEVMSCCWEWQPFQRPTFKEIVERLEDHVSQSFRLAAFCYSSQGLELHLNAGARPRNPPAGREHHNIHEDDDEGRSRAPRDDYYSRYKAGDEEVDLFLGSDPSRPDAMLMTSYRNQRENQPYHFSPGSPSPSCSNQFSLDSS